jgi:Leu/Phe-tRNA-protein transferase
MRIKNQVLTLYSQQPAFLVPAEMTHCNENLKHAFQGFKYMSTVDVSFQKLIPFWEQIFVLMVYPFP